MGVAATIFVYLDNTKYSDQQSAQVQSGWNLAANAGRSHAGMSPTLQALGEEEALVARKLALLLFQRFTHAEDYVMELLLAAILFCLPELLRRV
jgi:hypothetical protein